MSEPSKSNSNPSADRAARIGSGAASRSLEPIVHPSFHPELVPVFMNLEADLFRKLNEKAAVRSIGYDAMVRLIIREHLADYE